MTQAEAQEEAIRRWGDRAFADTNPTSPVTIYRVSAGGGLRFGVSTESWEDAFAQVPAMSHEKAIQEAERRWGNGSVAMLPLVGCAVLKAGETMGTGHSWEAAFADADRRTVEKEKCGCEKHRTREDQ
jgi:hypothetical protein